MSSIQRSEQKNGIKSVNPDDSSYGLSGAVLLDERQWSYIQKRYRMSPREIQVAKLVCRGFTNGDIARQLRVKPGTVKTHLRSIFNKTRARNKISLLLKFIENVRSFFSQSNDLTNIRIVDSEKPMQKQASVDEPDKVQRTG